MGLSKTRLVANELLAIAGISITATDFALDSLAQSDFYFKKSREF